MTLRDILQNIETQQSYGSLDINIESLCYDSRQVKSGTLFFAIEGEQSDGHKFIDSAIEQGACAIVCQHAEELRDGITYIIVESSSQVMGEAASAFYQHPSRDLKLVGITGTNGKTTTATLLYELYKKLGYQVGLISTVVYKIGERSITSTHTTPDSLRLNAMLREMCDAGCQYCFMEVSSHSIVQHRIAGLRFEGAAFSNITRDHLDYHGTFAEYIAAKRTLFDSLPREAFALTNRDDRNGEVMLQNTAAKRYSYSLRSMADFKCKMLEMHIDGMLLRLDGEEIWVNCTGRFNAYNMLTIYAIATLLGTERTEILSAMSSLGSVSGRFETIRSSNGITAIVDYAHTPDALRSVIETIEEIRQGANQLFVVCGCGGNRDRGKRPEMARIAVEGATRAIFTSDNPRNERPEDILSDMTEGIAGGRYLKIVDRREAIRTAVMLAQAGDIILVAGKGHETYQIIGDERLHFDDHEVLREAFAEIN